MALTTFTLTKWSEIKRKKMPKFGTVVDIAGEQWMTIGIHESDDDSLSPGQLVFPLNAEWDEHRVCWAPNSDILAAGSTS